MLHEMHVADAGAQRDCGSELISRTHVFPHGGVIAMSFLDRFMKRFRQPASTRRKSGPRKRRMVFEPLEERRLLAAVPTNFVVSNGVQALVEMRWDLMQDATGYEIERSFNGIDSWTNIGVSLGATRTSFKNEYFRSYGSSEKI